MSTSEKGGAGGAIAALVFLSLFFLGAGALFMGRTVTSTSMLTGVGGGYTTQHEEHGDGSLRSSEMWFQGETGEVRRRAVWDESGALVAAESGLFVGGARVRALSADEERDLRALPSQPAGMDPAPSLTSED